MLATLLSISHKYHALAIWRRAIKALQDDFPDNAEGFMKIRKAAQPTDTFDWEFYSAVLREAQKAEAQVLLPAVFLQVMAQPLPSIINAPQLDEEDRKAIIIRRDDVAKLSRTGLFNVSRVSTNYSATCCSYSWDYLRQEIYTVETFHDPFSIILRYQMRDPYAFHNCRSCCREATLSCCDTASKAFWWQLPGTLGLPGWEKLKEAAQGEAGVTIKCTSSNLSINMPSHDILCSGHYRNTVKVLDHVHHARHFRHSFHSMSHFIISLSHVFVPCRTNTIIYTPC